MNVERTLRKLNKKRLRVVALLGSAGIDASGADGHVAIIKAGYKMLGFGVEPLATLGSTQYGRLHGFYDVILRTAKRRAKGFEPKPTKKEKKLRKTLSPDFYQSREWQEVRYEALRANDGLCELCGRGRRHGTILHVDHIKPKSKYPELALSVSNLQVLCEDCNLGKSNKDETDWRDQDRGPRLAVLMGERVGGLDG